MPYTGQAEGVLLRSRVVPILQEMIENWRGPNFTVQLPTTEMLNFWDMARCDEVLESMHFK
jgi:hypothetical protein